MKLLFKMPGFSRYMRLSTDIWRMSLTRALQYEVIKDYPLRGKVLDVGGGDCADYRSWLMCESYESVNIDSSMNPTWVIEEGDPLPCLPRSFDTVISFNTLEHIFDVQSVLREMFRVLNKNGELLITTPFLFPIHGHPDDFFRPTSSWYRQILIKVGFKDVEVVPLAWGPFSTGLICSGTPGPAKAFRKQVALLVDLIYMRLRKKQVASVVEEKMQRFATAFMVRAIK